MESLTDLTRRYFAALQRGIGGEELAAYYTDDVIQQEFPNRLQPQGTRRNLAGILEAAARGQGVMACQHYEILNLVEAGDCVAVEFRWSGTLATPVGSLPAGGEIGGRFATFLKIRDGRICVQHSYDCFDPF
jgi:ketosteroid isomerase-like protein